MDDLFTPDEWRQLRRPPARPHVEATDEPDLPYTEAQLFARIVRACERRRVLWFHVYDGQVCRFGFPDLFIVGPGGIVLWELKSAVGELSDAQQAWAQMLRAAGAPYSVIRPQDWADGKVERWLDELTGEP